MGKLLFTIYKCNQCKNVFVYPNGYRYPETHCPNCMAIGNKIKILKLIYEKKIKPSEIVFNEYSVKEE